MTQQNKSDDVIIPPAEPVQCRMHQCPKKFSAAKIEWVSIQINHKKKRNAVLNLKQWQSHSQNISIQKKSKCKGLWIKPVCHIC